MNFEKAHGGKVMIYFNEDEVHLGVNDRKDYFKVNIFKKFSRAKYEEINHEIKLIKDIADELRLNSSKFSE